jgi:hypothetical protein
LFLALLLRRQAKLDFCPENMMKSTKAPMETSGLYYLAKGLPDKKTPVFGRGSST